MAKKGDLMFQSAENAMHFYVVFILTDMIRMLKGKGSMNQVIT